MKPKEDRTPFKETKVAAFLKMAGTIALDKAPDLVDVGLKLATGNFSGALTEVGDLLGKSNSPEAPALLREFDSMKNDFEKEIYALEIQDRDSARSLQKAALAQDSWFAKHFLYILASFIILSATIMGLMLFFYEFPEGNKRMIEMFMDIYLFAGALLVLNFFFGSSKGSLDKTQMMKSDPN